MKNLSIIFSALLTSAVFACPNLTGHFHCKDFTTGAEQEVSISQKDINGITTYEVMIAQEGESKPEIMIYEANSIPKAVKNSDLLNHTETAYCEGNELKIKIEGLDSSSSAVLDAMISFNIDSNNDLYDSYIGSFGSNQFKFEETCKREIH